ELSTDHSGPTSQTTSFAGGVGSGQLWIHTGADDTIGSNQSGEVISYNGAAVGGPIDNNLGEYASLFRLDVTSLNGTNTARIDSQDDWIAWDLAVLVTGPLPNLAPDDGLGYQNDDVVQVATGS